MRQWTRAVAALGGAALLAAGGACGLVSGESGRAADAETVDPEAAADLAQLVNQTDQREFELNNAENRIIEDCMEDRGHLVHDEWTLMDIEAGAESRDLASYYPHSEWLPEPEPAAEWGFGAWASSPEGMDTEAAADYFAETAGEESSVPKESRNVEFDALGNEERRAWYVDYGGEEWAQAYYAGNYLTEAEMQELFEQSDSEPGGQLDLGHPKPAGCLLEMIEAVYGEPEFIEPSEPEPDAEEPAEEGWTWRPEAPISEYDLSGDELYTQWSDRLIDLQDAMLDCLDDRGHGDWQFTQWGELPTQAFWDQIYYGAVIEEDEGEDGREVPAPPEDLPDDYEGRKAYEIDMAVDFAECADDSGYRQASIETWDQLHYEIYAEFETELYAWQEEIEAALTKAQEVIAA